MRVGGGGRITSIYGKRGRGTRVGRGGRITSIYGKRKRGMRVEGGWTHYQYLQLVSMVRGGGECGWEGGGCINSTYSEREGMGSGEGQSYRVDTSPV